VSVNNPPKTQSSATKASKTVYDSEDVFTVLSSDSDDKKTQESWREPLPENVLFALDQVSDIRKDKVEKIKKEMDAGNYKINAEKLDQVAGSMINADDLVVKLLD